MAFLQAASQLHRAVGMGTAAFLVGGLGPCVAVGKEACSVASRQDPGAYRLVEGKAACRSEAYWELPSNQYSAGSSRDEVTYGLLGLP
jgi:hypothetical protein